MSDTIPSACSSKGLCKSRVVSPINHVCLYHVYKNSLSLDDQCPISRTSRVKEQMKNKARTMKE